MYKGKQLYYKNEMLVYLTQLLILDGKCDPEYISNKLGITRRTLSSYINTIKNSLAEMMVYHIQVEYDKNLKLYICKLNL